jgi:hypothetical protein
VSRGTKKLTAGPLAISEAQRRREAKARWVEAVNYTTAYYKNGVRQTTVPLPMPGCDRNAPWGHDENGLVIAPFGIGHNGLPRRRLPGNVNGGRGPVRCSITKTLEEKLEGLHCDPIALLAEIAMDRSVEPRDRVKAASELCNYIYPKRRSVEQQGSITSKHLYVIAMPPESQKQLSSADWLQSLPDLRADHAGGDRSDRLA